MAFELHLKLSTGTTPPLLYNLFKVNYIRAPFCTSQRLLLQYKPTAQLQSPVAYIVLPLLA